MESNDVIPELTPADAFRRAVAAARVEQWHEVLDLLTRVAQRAEARGNLPGLFYSCLGVAVARCQGQRKEGLELCRYAAGIQPEEPDNYLHLATVYLLLGRRGAAARAITEGLKLVPAHRRLLALHRKIGVRRSPSIRFLDRANPLNVLIGQLLHRITTRAEASRTARAEARELDALGALETTSRVGVAWSPDLLTRDRPAESAAGAGSG